MITVRDTSPVAQIELNRPERRNAVTYDLIRALITACEQVSRNTEIRAVVLSAQGSDFSVGADLDQFSEAHSLASQTLLARRREAELGAHLLRALQDIPQPTICALDGAAVGAGACIAMACDFRVASDATRLGFSEVRMGMNLMWGAVPSLVALVGPSKAKQMLLSGALFDASTLADWGLVDTVCTDEKPLISALAWAERLAAMPPIAVQMIKRSVNRYALALAESITHMDSDQWLLTTCSDDFQEAVAAFEDKRSPQYTGN